MLKLAFLLRWFVVVGTDLVVIQSLRYSLHICLDRTTIFDVGAVSETKSLYLFVKEKITIHAICCKFSQRDVVQWPTASFLSSGRLATKFSIGNLNCQ